MDDCVARCTFEFLGIEPTEQLPSLISRALFWGNVPILTITSSGDNCIVNG